jgi:hypothetical protein
MALEPWTLDSGDACLFDWRQREVGEIRIDCLRILFARGLPAGNRQGGQRRFSGNSGHLRLSHVFREIFRSECAIGEVSKTPFYSFRQERLHPNSPA